MVHWLMVVELCGSLLMVVEHCGSLVDGGRTLWFIGGWW